MQRVLGASMRRASSRNYSSGALPPRKVVVLGAAGGIGQPLSLLMKLNPYVKYV